ncbi:lipid kinase [Nocardioides perillae]|uniref:YegS/Rv2252/BmrU family lipid kinase n=1 Tax=Nocardioides perillae TaxID=1119534 RepID=A0A7Y9RTJ5_9ACTN|nr:YegS/Rv2252/BmrU family lipid kinase [Nocardioides perillae]
MPPHLPLTPLHPGAAVALVVNAGSRRGAAALPDVRRLLATAGPRRLDVHPVVRGADLRPALEAAVAGGPDLLVVGGGDGTVGCAADLVAGTDVPLGVLPLGTANDFARTLAVPTDVASAVDALRTGHVVDVDLGRADGRVFLNVASLGLSVGVTQRLTARAKRWLGPAAYPAATLAAYRHHRPFAARLDFPGGDHAPLALDDLLQVAVGNGVHYGGGNAVSPTASVDDHLLDVYAIVRGRLRDHVSIARFLRDGSFVEHERVVHLTTRAVTVSTDRPMPVNLDGELAAGTPTAFAVERNALHVVVPAHSTAARLDGRDGPR